ncbi:hypothetical protein IP70_08255 [alpha proteobacterium AAP38]|nr:hypothetical protein IP70_08255 [alpha proteobacterium AAP38]
MNPDKIAHLGFIQSIIMRMGTNSFMIKGWGVTLVAAIFALSSKDSNKPLVLLAYFPVFMFWFLDAFILHQERLFRKLYEEIAYGKIPSDHFTLNTDIVKQSVPDIFSVFFSKTLIIFYGLIISMIFFAMVKIL